MPRSTKEPNICLMKTEHVCTFVNMLRQIDANIYQYIEQAGLPANVLTTEHPYLPEQISVQSDQQRVFVKLLNSDKKLARLPDFFTSRNFSAVCIEPELLALPYHPKLTWQHEELNVTQMPDFYESLLTALPPYLLAGKLPIEQAAKITGMSVRTLQRNLQALGKNYRQVLEELQSKQAKTLLADATISITTISEHLGYSNIAHFSRAFKKALGVTPSQYRRQHQLSDQA